MRRFPRTSFTWLALVLSITAACGKKQGDTKGNVKKTETALTTSTGTATGTGTGTASSTTPPSSSQTGQIPEGEWAQSSNAPNGLPVLPQGQTLGGSAFGGPIAPSTAGSLYDVVPPPADASLLFSGFPAIDFGRIVLGSTATRRVFLANFGQTAALGLYFSLSIEPDEFRVTGGTCGYGLPGLSSCYLDIEFTPKAQGAQEPVLRVQYLVRSGNVRSAYRTLRAEGAPIPQMLGMGNSQTCATVNGRVKCWGYNGYGGLGDNSTAASYVPVAVYGIDKGATAVTSGQYHGCAIVDGGMKCWGYNGYGQLGVETPWMSKVPVSVPGLSSGVTWIAAAEWVSCAVQNGAAKCWGYNGYGQLGNNSNTSSSAPVPVYGLSSGVSQIAAGYAHACALTTAGAVKCWGQNYYSQLGNNSTTSSNVPVPVYGLDSGVVKIATNGWSTCALKATGQVVCWGYNAHGQLGNNSYTSSSVPVPVYGLDSGVTNIAVGQGHACAVKAGALKCWGYNGYGQLGNGSWTGSTVPVAVSEMSSGVTAVDASYFQTCAIKNERAYCWGYNGYGQLGNNSTSTSSVPFAVYAEYLYP